MFKKIYSTTGKKFPEVNSRIHFLQNHSYSESIVWQHNSKFILYNISTLESPGLQILTERNGPYYIDHGLGYGP